MKKFIKWDSTNKKYVEDIVTWKDVDLSNFDIHDILKDRKPNTLLAIDENNNFTYLPVNDVNKNKYNNILGEQTFTDIYQGDIVDVTHFKDLFNLRQVDVFQVQRELNTEDILAGYTIISGSYQNPIVLDPGQSIIFSYTFNTLDRSDFNIIIDNTIVEVQVYFTYDDVNYFTIDTNGNIVFVDYNTDQGMDLTTLNSNLDNLVKGYDKITLVFKITNNDSVTQTVSRLDLEYNILSYITVSTSYYNTEFVSPSITRLTFNQDILGEVLIRITAPLFKDTKDIVLAGSELKTITYPIDLTSAVITVFELLSSTTTSTKVLRIEFDDPNKYIYDPITTTIDGSVKFKTFYTQNFVPYVTDKPIIVVSTGYYDLHFLTQLNKIVLLLDDKNPTIECKFALTFDDGVTWIGWDPVNSTFQSFTVLDEVITKGFSVDNIDTIPWNDLTNQYGKMFNIAISFRTLDRSNSDDTDFDTTIQTSNSQNVTRDLNGNVVHKLTVPEVWGNIITVTNPSNYPVINYPVMVDLSTMSLLPFYFEIIDTKTNGKVYYFFTDDKYRYKQTLTTKKIVMVIPYLDAGETRTYKMISTTNGAVHPTKILDYYLDPSLGYAISGSGYTIGTDGFYFTANNGVSRWYYLPYTEDLAGRELIVYWKQHPDYSWWGNTALYLYTSDYKLSRSYHYTGRLIYNIPWKTLTQTVDETTYLEEKVELKCKTYSDIDIKITNLTTNTVYEITDDASTALSSIPKSLILYPRLYLYGSGKTVGCVLESMITRQHLEQPLQVTAEYIPYPSPEYVEITFANPVNLNYLQNVDEYWMKLNFEYLDVELFGWQVSPDGNTWYYYNPNTNTFEAVGTSLLPEFTGPNTGIPVHIFKKVFNTNLMYIKLTGGSYEFKLNPKVTFYNFPKDNTFAIDDILIEYNVNAHYEIATDVYIAIQNTNTLVIKNESTDIKQLKVNIVG